MATEQSPTVDGIHGAMAAILAGVRAIPKSARNQAQGFSFRSIDVVMTELHALMAKHGVYLLPEVIDRAVRHNERTTCVDLCVRMRFVAVDGSEVAATVWGEGRDNGDKATSKAHTMALKTGLLQAFMVPTADLADPDATTVTDERPARQQDSRRAARGRQTSSGPDTAEDQQRTSGKDSGRGSVSPSAAVAAESGPDDSTTGGAGSSLEGGGRPAGASPEGVGDGGPPPSGTTAGGSSPPPADEPLPDLGADATDAERAFHEAGFTVKQVSELLVERWPDMAAQYTPAKLRKLTGSRIVATVSSARSLHERKRAAAQAQDDAAEGAA